MQQLILKTDIEQGKMDALLNFLKSWDIDAELKTTSSPTVKKKGNFSLSAGLWKGYNIDANNLRKQAWSRNK